MSGPDPDDPVLAAVELALFEEERRHVDRVRAIAADPAADAATLRTALAGILGEYDTLLARFAKIARLSDASHNRLQRTREELDRQNALLREHVRLQEDVERMSRHDLRTPLASIVSIPDLLLMRAGLDEADRDLLRGLQEAGRRVLDMVNLSLDLFRMERGSYPFAPHPVDLGDLARRVADDLSAAARTAGVTFRFEPAEEGPYVAGAEDLLTYSMLANLFRNALEASPRGAEVTLRLWRASGEVGLSIHNALPVAEDLRGRFFEKYQTRKRGGTGLGAYSARLMAETQGGRIGVETSDAHGTTLTVVLPAAEDERPARRHAEAGANRARPALPPLRVVVAEDDALQREFLASALPSPLVVEVVADGKAAVAAAARLRPDVVFLDMEMPVMNGPDAARALREQEARLKLPRAFVVGLSAHDDPAMAVRFHEAGCDRYLVKPVEPEQLDHVLRAVHPAPRP